MSSSSRNSKPTKPHDITSKKGLTDLYNQPVVRAERVERPLEGQLGKVGVKHSGVVLTLADGKQYLAHKGKDYGNPRGGDTVVVDTKHMSKNWVATSQKTVQGATLGDYVKTGGKEYNVFTDNCHDGSKRMMNFP